MTSTERERRETTKSWYLESALDEQAVLGNGFTGLPVSVLTQFSEEVRGVIARFSE